MLERECPAWGAGLVQIILGDAMLLRRAVLLALLLALAAPSAFSQAPAEKSASERATLSLAGTWHVRLDPGDVGQKEHWAEAAFTDEVRLPGSTDENRLGTPTPADYRGPEAMQWLTRRYKYLGPAWYQREVEIPADWQGRRIALFLERCHWESRVWVDGRPQGSQNSLCAPHEYDLSDALTPGKHRLTISIDNRLKIDVGQHGHSVSEHTQTNWNGIIGRIELVASEPVWIESVQVYPDVAKQTAHVRATVVNGTKKPLAGALAVEARPEKEAAGRSVAQASQPFRAEPGRTPVELDLPMGSDVQLWDEFTPNLYTLTASLGRGDRKHVSFGMRQFGTKGTQFAVNGRPTFLRGTLECCIFPRTGYPSMDVEAWTRICKILKSYGLNHLRFHSWCPPEAAFVAADRCGVLLHVETPLWVDGPISDNAARIEFIRAEFLRILDTYGNHPSFCLMCMGNELGGGEDPLLQELVATGHQHDSRHLYTCSTRPTKPQTGDDYFIIHKTPQGPLRGEGRFYSETPNSQLDYRNALAGYTLPVVSHEIGQWTIYPNFAEISKYTGVVWPRNFELIRESLEAHHLLDQAPDFVRASGKLMLLLYREEIEASLRTPGFAGFQLLDMRDFPGQGTALVGMLDPFWESKGLIEPAAMRRYCGPIVPLIRMAKRTWTSDETLSATVDVAHYGPEDLKDVQPRWTVRDEVGHTLASGQWPKQTVATGGLRSVGPLEFSLASVSAPAKLRVEVSIEGTEVANDEEFWVYPAKLDTDVPAGVVAAKEWADARTSLVEGKRVLWLPPLESLASTRYGRFTPIFWSPLWFSAAKTSTMGMLCNPAHPALAQFPTEFHTNWQWWDLVMRSRPVSLEATPADYRPVVQMIDKFSSNEKLGLVFEARVGSGRLLVSTIDLSSDLESRPVARQLRHSLLSYMASEQFAPKTTLEPAVLEALQKKPEGKP